MSRIERDKRDKERSDKEYAQFNLVVGAGIILFWIIMIAVHMSGAYYIPD